MLLLLATASPVCRIGVTDLLQGERLTSRRISRTEQSNRERGERERHTDRQTDRQRQRQREPEKRENQRDRETERQRDRE
jgi:hypothetical protein